MLILLFSSGGSSGPGFGAPGSIAGGSSSNMFGSVDAVVKFVLEGHSCGVNWASFHPTQNLVVSGADDKEVKVWRMSGSRAWETTTYRGHLNNVSCVLFHPKENCIISSSEDRTLRIFDVTHSLSPQVFKRDDRYWVLAVHPRLNLLAAGHDSGMFVFKLSRERPAVDSHSNKVIYFKEGYLRLYDVARESDTPVMQIRSSSSSGGGGSSSSSSRSSKRRPLKPRRLLFNHYATRSQCNVLLFYDNSPTVSSAGAGGLSSSGSSRSFFGSSSSKDSQFELYCFSPSSVSSSSKSSKSRSKKFSTTLAPAQSVAFVSRNRFAVLDCSSGDIELRNFDNEVRKKLKVFLFLFNRKKIDSIV